MADGRSFMTPIYQGDSEVILPGLLRTALFSYGGIKFQEAIDVFTTAQRIFTAQQQGNLFSRPPVSYVANSLVLQSSNPPRQANGICYMTRRLTLEQLQMIVSSLLDAQRVTPGLHKQSITKVIERYQRALDVCQEMYTQFEKMIVVPQVPYAMRHLTPYVDELAQADTLSSAIDASKEVNQACARLSRVEQQEMYRLSARLFCSNWNVAVQYCFGDCNMLALALRDQTGKDVATCHSSTEKSSDANGCHSFLMMDEHTPLDIHGLHTRKTFLKSWEAVINFPNDRITNGQTGKPMLSTSNDRSLYEGWTPYRANTPKEDHQYAAKQVLMGYSLQMAGRT